MTPYALLAPAGLFLSVLIVATLMILRLSFGRKGGESAWTFENYLALGQHLYATSIFLTLKLAFLSAVIVVILGFPIAMFLVRTRNEAVRRLILLALLLPLLMSTLLQAYGWMIIMAPAGMLSRLAQFLGLTSGPLLLMFNQTGVLIGLVHGSFPIAVFPIASALRNIPKSLEEAAGTLGANRPSVLWHIVFPLSLPGVLSASLLVFGWNASALVIPYLLGGRRVPMLALLILDQMGAFLDWPFGSANAVVLVVITLIILVAYQRITLRYLDLWRG
jgi:putative spermidine/putrescine transport system permease protein